MQLFTFRQRRLEGGSVRLDKTNKEPFEKTRPGSGITGGDTAPGKPGDRDTPGNPQLQPPSIALPKGGGAIRGIGEKFAANPATGTGSMTVPIATSPGRSGFDPQLSLSYDSGAGNGPFGIGWSLALPSITRKTDKGLPTYRDREESDVFILSGAEDLVPCLHEIDAGQWQTEAVPPRTIEGKTYTIRRYRPRIEGLFARIERWTNQADAADTCWRSISSNNVTSWYGKTQESRIADPADPRRIFSWLICQSYDDKGNAMVYRYVAEDSANIDLSQTHEANRTTPSRSANRYLKRIQYGNKTSRLIQPDLTQMEWLFEVVFDYGEGHYQELGLDPLVPEAEQHRLVRAALDSVQQNWPVRPDPLSSYRAGFEARTYRRCQRVLMFHRFSELGVEPYLVRSTEFHYNDLDYTTQPTLTEALTHQGSTRFASHIRGVTQSGYVHHNHQPIKGEDVEDSGGIRYATYIKKSLPPLEFEYSKAAVQQQLHTITADDLEHLPQGLDTEQYQWVDLDGEGVGGILTEQAGAWFYKRNLSPLPGEHEPAEPRVRFAPAECVGSLPSFADLSNGTQQILDLAGDGQVDVVSFSGPVPGFFERTPDGGWQPFRSFTRLPNISWNDPNLKFVDLTGDGHADILVTEQDAFTWYASMAEQGFDSGEKVSQALDEENGPKLLLADGTQSIHLTDLSGDGLTDLVRIRNGEVCYWPNLGYGRFGAKVTMDNSPSFDAPDHFDPRRIRLADIDGSGVTDIIYLKDDGAYIYLNEAGNRWADVKKLYSFPHIDNLSSVLVADLLGNGTACLVWSSPLPAAKGQPLRYIDLMGGNKPHLLIKSVNNLGAETRVHYAPSTRFYLADKAAGKSWITRLPFPVHVVEKVETYDHISRNRFVTRYAYHHGYFDGFDREYRGFGMVEQWDTEEFSALTAEGELSDATNIDPASHVPPVHTKTWFHTGIYTGRDHISDYFAGLLDQHDIGEYFREPGKSDAEARALLIPDTILPPGLTLEEEREACRALKGAMLHQEIYALDDGAKESFPYTVSEQNFIIRSLQPSGDNRHAVFFTHPRVAINYHYERNPADPRISHVITLEVDDFGNVLKDVSISYGRRQPDLKLSAQDQAKQGRTHITYTENRVTNATGLADGHRKPLPCETRTFELTGFMPEKNAALFSFEDWKRNQFEWLSTAEEIPYEQTANDTKRQKRLIEHVRILYRKDDLSSLLPLGQIEPMALPGESYQLAFTAGLAKQIYVDSGKVTQPILDKVLANEGSYVHSEGDTNWWIPSGRVYFHPDSNPEHPATTAGQELKETQQHFYLPRKYVSPFHTNAVSTVSLVTFDAYDLLTIETIDALDNRVTVGERQLDGTIDPNVAGNNYRVLQPTLVMGPNRNRSQVIFDAMGMVAGSAVMGKPEESLGDVLDGFQADLTNLETNTFLEATDPKVLAENFLKGATTRIVYDVDRIHKTRQDFPQEPDKWGPVFAATLARETHVSELDTGEKTKIQIRISYSDGFGHEIQQKIQAEPGPLDLSDPNSPVVDPRWVGSGWTIFNNKGKPVRQYEPFFDDTHGFRFGKSVGVRSVLFYDPIERIVATLHPNHTWDKVVFNPWQQEDWDVNDTALVADPKTDPDVGDFFRRLADIDYLPTWHALRTDPNYAAEADQRWPDPKTRDAEKRAADKLAVHAVTPTVACADSLSRTFLTVAHNKFKYSNTAQGDPPDEEFYNTRIILDIEGNQREVVDAKDRIAMRYNYDMLGNRILQASMEASQRWILNDVTRNPIRAWDSRGHQFRTAYDQLRRPVESYMSEGAGSELLVERIVYGESRSDPETNNLRGQVVELFDQAGVVTTDDYGFKGNLLSSGRQLARAYKKNQDWSAAVPLEAGTYTSHIRYDALNRPIQLTAPHNDQPGTKINVIQPDYNKANLLEQLNVWLNQDAEPTDLLDPATANLKAVTDIDYDAKGQRTLIDYGNGVRTTYKYDPLTLRLLHLLTRRNDVAFPDDCPQPSPAGWPGCKVQNLHYTYDPAGNITHMRDDAQQTVFFRNKRVEPSAEYTYDAIYRLIEATGREHLGQVGGAPIPHSYNDFPRAGLLHPGDGSAMGTYLERYIYDVMGNILQMQHRGTDPDHAGWTRSYDYLESSQLESAKIGNRLSKTTVGNNNPPVERYLYDAHGNMTRMPQMGGTHPDANMHWDYQDQLHQTDLGGGGTAYYTYDSTGQRVRKVSELENGKLKDERIYLGGFEIYRQHTGANASLVRETLHIMDDQQRIAVVETRNEVDDGSKKQLIRYQLGNHLGSASVELDNQAQIISYEEYTPYGSTLYQAVRNQTETPKRYRHTGKERDEESGLYYHGARYYAAWLGRWTSADPAGLVDGVNVYAYVRGRPINFVDLFGTYSFSDVQSSSEYMGLKPTERTWVDKIIRTLKGRTNSREEYHAGKLMELLRVPDPTPQGSANREKAQRWKTSVSSWKAQQRDKNKTEAVLDREENASNKARFVKVINPGERKVGYYVDRNDPKNIHAKIKIKLKPFRQGVRGALDKFLIKSQEDEIEKFAGQTSGFTLDVEFVGSDYAGDDFIEVGVNYGEWVTAENFGGNTRTLTHEIMHRVGLDDRYDYIESHATNASMTKEYRLELFNKQLERQPDPTPGEGSLMGSTGSVDKTDTLLDWEVCNIAAYKGAAHRSCVSQR